MRNSYTPVENTDTEALNDFQYDTGYQLAESEWKHNYHIQATRINQTLILTKQGILFRRLAVCNCKGSASPRKQKAEWKKTSCTAWRLFSKHRMERRPFYHQSSALKMGKPHQKLGVYCVSQSSSFAQQLQRLPGTSSLWRALTGELKSPLAQQCAHGSLRGTAVLANSASWALQFLAALASLAAESQSPVERVAQIPQKPTYWLDKAPLQLRFLYWWGRFAPEPHGIASHLLNNRRVSVLSWQLLSYLQAHGIQHTISWRLQQFETVKCTVRIQTVWTHPLHLNALLWSQIPWGITMTRLHLAASQTYGMNLFVGIFNTDFLSRKQS